jgi:outer membrane putative beta-barrel porin/alpha-amylase
MIRLHTRLASALLLLPASALPQSMDAWQARVSQTQAEQPHWITPLVTVTPRLEQEFRFDVLRQLTPAGEVVNLGGGKGLELIPSRNIEIIIAAPPPYFLHNNPDIKDGFGDETFLLKYRLLSGNDERGNYILTLFLGGAIPTGSYRNGSTAAVITPTVAAEKGFGRFSIQSTLGVGLPVDSIDRLGRALAWNTAFQYHVRRFLWPELEVNSTFFEGGTNDGKKQTFLTPGLVVGRIPLHNRLGLTLGTGMQIAATRFHAFDHSLIVTARLPF